jgi:hypothetical protein
MQIRSFSFNFLQISATPITISHANECTIASSRAQLHFFYQIEIGRIVATGADQNVPTNGRRSVGLLAAVHQMAWQAVLQK